MTSVKEDEKIMGPLFPRLHVNDTADKGGPRAPPRNKMALYEQLSIPSSQRFASATATPLRLPQRTSASSTQGGLERTTSSPYYSTLHTPRNSGDKVHNLSSDDGKAARMESEQRSTKQINHKSLVGAGTVAECSLPFAHESFKVRSASVGRLGDEDDCGVPTLCQSKGAAQLNKDRTALEAEPLTHMQITPRKGYSTAIDNQQYTSFAKISDHDYHKMSTEEVKHVFMRSAATTTLLKENKAKSPLVSEIREKSAESSRPWNASLVQEGLQAVNTSGNSEQIIGDLFEGERGRNGLGGPRCSGGKDLGESGDVADMEKETCPKTSHGVNCQPGISSSNNKSCTRTGSLGSKYGDVSGASVVVSLSGLEISPDDVVGVIGPKQFWKARRAIANQQRVFAVQVFELHRLIKVQKLIAASPHFLLEDLSCLVKTVPVEHTKHLSSKSIVKLHRPSIEGKDDIQKQNKSTDFDIHNMVPALLASNEDILNKGHSQAPRSGTYSGNPPPTPFTHENNPTPWFFPQPANQWLVPVMSPSEGLIYKPYSGPCPPGAGFVAQVYGSCPPAYGVPASHQQQNMGFFPGAPGIPPSCSPTSYGLPVVNPIISPSGVELVNPMVGFRPNCQIDQNSRSSCNMRNSKTEAFAGCLRNFQPSRGSEIQGSTASCPCDKTRQDERDALPLTSTARAAADSARPSEAYDKDNNQTRVIKVVPHNAISATESAERIFQSIQKERQQYDL